MLSILIRLAQPATADPLDAGDRLECVPITPAQRPARSRRTLVVSATPLELPGRVVPAGVCVGPTREAWRRKAMAVADGLWPASAGARGSHYAAAVSSRQTTSPSHASVAPVSGRSRPLYHGKRAQSHRAAPQHGSRTAARRSGGIGRRTCAPRSPCATLRPMRTGCGVPTPAKGERE